SSIETMSFDQMDDFEHALNTRGFFDLVTSTLVFFFFQAEDGIRDYKVTGVQTCALPIYPAHAVQLSTAGVLAHHHRRRILLVRGAIPDRYRARHGAAARGGDPHGPRARDAAVPRPQPPLRPGHRGRGRRVARAPGRAVDAGGDRPPHGAVRSEHW